jgi:hypothetical protein
MTRRFFALVAFAFSLALPMKGASVTHFGLTTLDHVIVHPGQPFSVTVTALDASNATVTDYAGTVHFSSSPAVALPADYTFVAEDNGVRSFDITTTVPGWLIIFAADTSNASIGGMARTYVIIPCPPGVPPRITTPRGVCAGSSTNIAIVSGTGPASLLWTITNGTITAGQGTDMIRFATEESGTVGFDVRATGAGPCYPSSVQGYAEIFPSPDADLGADLRGCIGIPARLRIDLTGTPPFTVRWSDGLVQSGIQTHTVTRKVTIDDYRTYTIDSVFDALCIRDDMHERIRVIGSTVPVIDSQSHHVQVRKGQTAVLTVSTSTLGVSYQWFEGNAGDTTSPIDNHSATFRTPVLERNAHYWVRLTTSCGSTDSAQIIAQVTGGKSRSARH